MKAKGSQLHTYQAGADSSNELMGSSAKHIDSTACSVQTALYFIRGEMWQFEHCSLTIPCCLTHLKTRPKKEKKSKLKCSQNYFAPLCHCETAFFLPQIWILYVVRMMAAEEQRWKVSRSLVCNSRGVQKRDFACLQCKQQAIIARLSIKLLGERQPFVLQPSHHCCCGRILIPTTLVCLFICLNLRLTCLCICTVCAR